MTALPHASALPRVASAFDTSAVDEYNKSEMARAANGDGLSSHCSARFIIQLIANSRCYCEVVSVCGVARPVIFKYWPANNPIRNEWLKHVLFCECLFFKVTDCRHHHLLQEKLAMVTTDIEKL